MAAHVQFLAEVENTTADQTSTVLSPSTTVTSGNVIVVAWGALYDITPSGVSDNLGNTYTRAERTRQSLNTADLWYAPVTSAGSITTITVAHASTQYVTATAAEFSGVGALSVAGAGTTGTSTTATWVTSKTIPANGLAVGCAFTNNTPGHTAGAASGSPSTSITKENSLAGGVGEISLCYALAGGSDVTSFSGTTTLGTSYPWAAAGGVFSTGVGGPQSLQRFIFG
jgi:hypothetical protein